MVDFLIILGYHLSIAVISVAVIIYLMLLLQLDTPYWSFKVRLWMFIHATLGIVIATSYTSYFNVY